jgi:hypothetical protein
VDGGAPEVLIGGVMLGLSILNGGNCGAGGGGAGPWTGEYPAGGGGPCPVE